jgi:hypothetical protein
MEAVRLRALHFAARATLIFIGATFLWYGVEVASIFGLLVMFIGLICAVTGFLAGDVVPRTLDALVDRIHAGSARRTAA